MVWAKKKVPLRIWYRQREKYPYGFCIGKENCSLTALVKAKRIDPNRFGTGKVKSTLTDLAQAKRKVTSRILYIGKKKSTLTDLVQAERTVPFRIWHRQRE